jgi:hypothetical protein
VAVVDGDKIIDAFGIEAVGAGNELNAIPVRIV